MSVETTDQPRRTSSPEKTADPSPPVTEGDQLTVEIEDVGDQGDGIARVDQGYILFVSETEPGDTVDVEVTDTMPNYGFAQPVEKQKPR